VTSDLQRQKQMGLNISACLFKIEFGQRRVVRTWASNHHVVDRSGQLVEKLREALKVGGIEGHSALRVEFARYLLKAVGIPGGEDKLAPSAHASRAVSCPMPALPPITITVCPASFDSRWTGEGVAVFMIPPVISL
jgi:hypothetical protein